MKHVKILGLALVAALVVFGGVGNASATVLYKTRVNAKGSCPAGWGFSGEIHATSEERVMFTGGLLNLECAEAALSSNLTEVQLPRPKHRRAPWGL